MQRIKFAIIHSPTYLRCQSDCGGRQAGPIVVGETAKRGQMLEQLAVLLQQLLGASLRLCGCARNTKSINYHVVEHANSIFRKNTNLCLDACVRLRNQLIAQHHQLRERLTRLQRLLLERLAHPLQFVTTVIVAMLHTPT